MTQPEHVAALIILGVVFAIGGIVAANDDVATDRYTWAERSYRDRVVWLWLWAWRAFLVVCALWVVYWLVDFIRVVATR